MQNHKVACSDEKNRWQKFADRIQRYPVLTATLLVFVLAVVIYSPTLRTPNFIRNEESVLNLALVSHCKNIPLIFSRDFLLFTSGQYRPIGYALLSIARTFVSPNHPVFWHLWLIAFHVMNAVLLFILVRHFTSRLSISFMAATLFCIHPLCTIHVNAIDRFHFILGSALSLGVLNAYITFVKKERKPYYVLAMVLYLIALFTVRQALAIGFILFAYELLHNKTRFRKIILRVSPFAVLPLVFYRVLFMTSPHPLHFKYVTMYEGSFWDGFFSVTGATGFVMNGLLSTRNLPVILHEAVTQIFDWNNPHFLLWTSFNAIVCLAAIWALTRKKWAALGILFMYLGMLPYATVYFNRVIDYVSFNYYYFPVAGLAFLIGGCFEWLYDKNHRVLKVGSGVCLAALILFWGGQSFQLNTLAKTPVTYWNDVLTKTQNIGRNSPIATNHLGKALLDRNKVSDALAILFSPSNESFHDSCLLMADYYINHKECLASAIHLHYCLSKESSGILYQSKNEVAAKLYTAVGALDYAEDNVGVVLMVNPYNTRMMAILASIWLWKGHLREARRTLDRIRGYDPYDPGAVRCQQMIDRYENDARAGKPVKPIPSVSAEWLDYAFKHQRSPGIRKEIVELSERVDPNDPIIQMEAMLSLMEENNNAEAVKKVDRVYRALNNNTYACAFVCELLAKTNHVDSAVDIGIRAVQLDKNNKLAWRNLAIAYAQKDTFNENDTAFLKQIDNNASFASIFYFNLGMQKRKQGNNKEAINLMVKGLKANPQNRDIYLILAESLTIAQQPERAVEVLKQGLTVKPDDPELYANLGISLAELRRWDEANEAYNTAIKLDPYNHYYHYNYAIGLMNQKKIDDAIIEYQRAVDLKPDFMQAVSQLGYCLIRAGRLDEAAAQYKIIIQSDPGFQYVHYNLATVYRMQKKYDLAIPEFEEAIKHNPGLAASYDALAQIYCQSGDFTQAKAIVDRANDRKIKMNAQIVKQVEEGFVR